MKILMFAYGVGNNIEPWLDFFQKNNSKYSLTFICTKFEFEKDNYSNINVIELSSRVKSKIDLIIHLVKHSYDVLYIHGFYSYLIRFLLVIFTNSKVKALNIWNNTNYKKATDENKNILKRKCYKFLLEKFDRLYFTWYGTYSDFTNYFPNLQKKMHLKPWGLRQDIFNYEIKVSSTFCRSYLDSINNEDIFIFWPETMSKHEHVDKFLLALNELKNSTNLRILLFSSTQSESDDYIIYLKKLIKENHLNYVDLVIGEYLPFQDIMALWSRSNMAVKFSTKDQLSSGILEAMYFDNPIILNTWIPYKKLQDEGFNIFLTSLDIENIKMRLEQLISKTKDDTNFFRSESEKNKRLIEQKFNFEKNIENIFIHLGETIIK